MDRTDEPEDGSGPNGETGTLLARTWVIAANFRTPADYGIPAAPSFAAERRADGTLVLVEPDDSTPVMTVENPIPVRR